MSRGSTAVQEAIEDLQQPGSDLSLSSGDVEVRFEDPRRVMEELCEIAARPDPGTKPWPQDNDEPAEYLPAENAQEIGKELISRIVRLRFLADFRIHYLFRNVKSWEKVGRTVFGDMSKPSGLLKNYAAADFIVRLNWQVWQALNPMQRVALVYHELRHGDEDDAKPKLRGHDWEGFHDELKIFGTRTYEDWNALGRAVSEGAGFTHQFSLGLFEVAD